MTTNVSLIDDVNARVTPGMISTMSSDLGASPLQIGGAVRRAIPTVFAGIMEAGSTEIGASRVLHAATQAHGTGILDRRGALDADETRKLGAQGERMLGFVFGDRATEGIDAVARSSSTSREVAVRVLGTIAPIALAVIGREAVSRRLDAAGLMRFLRERRPAVLANADLPRDVALGRMVSGAETVSVVETPVARTVTRAPPPPLKKKSSAGLGWLLALLGLLALVVLLMSALGGTRRAREPESKLPRVEAPVARAPEAPVAPLPAPIGGTQPSEEPTSTTTTTGAAIDRPDLSSYKLHFEFASTQLVGDGEQSLKGISDTLIANPSERIKLVGHTDSIGDQDFNNQLALNRAVVVKKELIARGVDASRIDVSGPGESKPIADNATKEGRAENRRVEVMEAGAAQ